MIGHGQAGPSALVQGVAQAWRNVEKAIRAASGQISQNLVLDASEKADDE